MVMPAIMLFVFIPAFDDIATVFAEMLVAFMQMGVRRTHELRPVVVIVYHFDAARRLAVMVMTVVDRDFFKRRIIVDVERHALAP